MNNPETLATLGIQNKNTTQKAKKMSNTDPAKKNRGELGCSQMVSISCFS